MAAKLSYNDEEAIIADLFSRGRLPLRHEFCVDVGASDGLTMSNTHFLFAGGWRGLAVEYDPGRFARLAQVHAGTPGLTLARTRVTPDNVVPLLAAYETPRDFDFLSLDIDGYDHFVLDRILSAYRPTLVCAEINEKIPPPVKFTVKFHPDYVWGENHFYGQSLSKLHEQCERHDYAVIRLEYCNAFLVPKEINQFEALTAERAYREGYWERPDRLARFPWNVDMDDLQRKSPTEVVGEVERRFARYKGQFECSL
jgi:hypothetical protein